MSPSIAIPPQNASSPTIDTPRTERHRSRPRSARSTSPPPNAISRDTYYAQWPYYNPPGGWVYRPVDDTDESWRSFAPPGLAEPPDERSALAHAHPYGFFPHWSPDRGVYIEGGNPDAFPGSPFFARGDHDDPQFVAYRRAQKRSPCDRTHPLIHPALAYHAPSDGPELLWDLTEHLSAEAIVGTARVRVDTDELDIAASAPPLRQLRVRLHAARALYLDLLVPRRRAIDLRMLLAELANFLQKQRLTVGEYQALPARLRDRLAAEHQRRMGSVVLAAAFGDTPYLMRDALGDKVMFRGLEMITPAEWVLHTTTRSRAKRGRG